MSKLLLSSWVGSRVLVPNLATRVFGTLWLALAIVIFVYSYGFVDLNLTLSSHPLVFKFISWAQQLVYFNRDLSLIIFITLIILMFLLYLGTLRHWYTHKFAHFPWKLVVVLGLIFSLAYPMLSSDIFKYLFAAKEILVYGANPYLVTPDTFSDDTWIRFMRWVHTTTPYGPVFIALTIPYYLIAFGKFVPMLYLFKLDQLAWYLISIYLIGQITRWQKWSPQKTRFAQLFFALNPLILMEWLVNAHNDAIMITLLLLSYYLYLKRSTTWSFLSLLFSIGIKYVTVIFLPFILLKQRFSPNLVLGYLLLALFAIPLLYHYSWQYQPWYVTWLIPLVALTPSTTLRATICAYSLSVFSRYYFFVGTGSWLGTPAWHALMTFALPATVFVLGLVLSKRSPPAPKG